MVIVQLFNFYSKVYNYTNGFEDVYFFKLSQNENFNIYNKKT